MTSLPQEYDTATAIMNSIMLTNQIPALHGLLPRLSVVHVIAQELRIRPKPVSQFKISPVQTIPTDSVNYLMG